MVDDYLSEREQAEALREWWNENWRWLVGGIALGFALLGGWTYWKSYSTRRAESASSQYTELKTAVDGNDAEKVEQLLSGLTKEYGSSPYVQQGRLSLAKMRVEASKIDEGIALLRTVADTASDDELRTIARTRVARLLLQQGKPDEALQQLDADKAGKFAPYLHETRGDALVAKGDVEGARAEYAAALKADADAPVDRAALELKLAGAGGSSAVASADPAESGTGEQP